MAAGGALPAGDTEGPGVRGRHRSQPSFCLPATSGASPPQDGQRTGAKAPAGSSQSKVIGYRRSPRRTSAGTRSAGTSITCSRYGRME